MLQAVEFPQPDTPKLLIEGNSSVSHPFLANFSIRFDPKLSGKNCSAHSYKKLSEEK